MPLEDSVNEPHLRQVDMSEECHGQYLFLFIPLQNICFIWDIWNSGERQENRVIWCANAIKLGIKTPFWIKSRKSMPKSAKMAIRVFNW